jgi:hypothetical protein
MRGSAWSVDLTCKNWGITWGHMQWCMEDLALVLESPERDLLNGAKIKRNGPHWRPVAMAERPELQVAYEGA